MKKLITSIIFLIIFKINAQQDVQYTHYMYNMSLVNPAYTSNDYSTINMGVLHRTQWVGIKGNTTSSSAFVHVPLKSGFEVGATFLNDNIDNIIKENNLYVDVAYGVYLSRNSKLSFGFKSGVNFLRNDFSDFNLQSGAAMTDPNFANNLNKTFFNFGLGLYYNTDKMYLGFSIPNFIQTKHITATDASNVFYGKEQAHAYFTGGYVYTLNEKVKLKPSFLVKAVSGAPLSYDVNANAIFNDKVEVGLGYRFEDAISGVINFSVSPVLKIGYSYDYNTSALNNFNSGSHEFILLYDFITNLSGVEKSPRYF